VTAGRVGGNPLAAAEAGFCSAPGRPDYAYTVIHGLPPGRHVGADELDDGVRDRIG